MFALASTMLALALAMFALALADGGVRFMWPARRVPLHSRWVLSPFLTLTLTLP